MKSKPFLFLFFVGLSFALSAQTISVKSFKLLPTDMTASSLEGRRLDQNNEVAALIRVVTSETDFSFEAGALGIVDTKQKVGEIWVWVPRGSRKISIMHQKLGVLREYRYPIEIEAERTYEMQLITGKVIIDVEEEIQQQYLTFQVSPANAVLEVNGQLWEVGPDGSSTKFVDLGTYKYRVQAPNYHSDAGMVIANDPGGKQRVNIALKPDFVEVTLKTEANAEIWINDEKKGVGTWTGPLGKGIYMIECKKANHETTKTSQEITDAQNGQTITLPAPRPIYGSLNIESTPNYAMVYIDGKAMGETPLFIKEVLVGTHELKLTKDGHSDHTETITIAKGERKQVKAVMENADYETIAKKGDEYFEAKNYEEALKCYREAAEHGNARGQNGMGILYNNGYAVQKDHAEAVKWYRKAAEQGNDRAQCNLGYMYDTGKGVAQDYAEAVKWYRKAAEQGNDRAQNNLGTKYEDGQGVTQDYTEAFKWYKKAAEHGNVTAQSNIGRIYADGIGVAQNDVEAVKWYRKAAEQGDAIAQCNLGYMYEEELGIEQSNEEAMKWYRKAAEQGLAQAQNNLAFMYKMIENNYVESFKWYKMSAEQGDPGGQCGIGEAYFEGLGVQQNTKEGLKWLHMAAEQKYGFAAYKLWQIYLSGENGVTKDEKKAQEWEDKAYEYGWY